MDPKIIDELIFGAFLARVLAPTHPLEQVGLVMDVNELRGIEHGAAARLREDRARYLRDCHIYSEALQRMGPPAHTGGA